MQMLGSYNKSSSSESPSTAEEPTSSFIEESPTHLEDDLPF